MTSQLRSSWRSGLSRRSVDAGVMFKRSRRRPRNWPPRFPRAIGRTSSRLPGCTTSVTRLRSRTLGSMRSTGPGICGGKVGQSEWSASSRTTPGRGKAVPRRRPGPSHLVVGEADDGRGTGEVAATPGGSAEIGLRSSRVQRVVYPEPHGRVDVQSGDLVDRHPLNCLGPGPVLPRRAPDQLFLEAQGELLAHLAGFADQDL